MKEKKDIKDLNPKGLERFLATFGEPAYRTSQVFLWIYKRRVPSFAAMTDLPAALRDRLASTFLVRTALSAAEQKISDGTCKLLLRYPDRQAIECVLIPARRRCTACLSVQVGCRYGCVFCASGENGLVRNLTPGEMADQILALADANPKTPITHVVLMGSGEPFDNWPAVRVFLRLLHDPDRLGFGARRVTLSTWGHPSGIRRLAEEGPAAELAISLHAPEDGLRRRIMPTAGKTPLREVLSAARFYREKTGRIVTYEYILIAGVTDTPACAERLAYLLNKENAKVNLIPLHPTSQGMFQAPTEAQGRDFLNRLRRLGLRASLRRSRGASIHAACGQLRAVRKD